MHVSIEKFAAADNGTNRDGYHGDMNESLCLSIDDF